MDPQLRRRIRFTGYWSTAAFLFLAAAFAYWQVYRSNWLLVQPYNHHMKVLERRIKRGAIRDVLGRPLAVSTAGGPGHRAYPTGSLCAHVIGYLSERYGRVGIEGELDPQLSGMGATPSPLKLNPLLAGGNRAGDDVYLTLNLAVQKAAAAALGNRRGAVVALDPRGGRVLALVSRPTYDPATVDANWASLSADPRRPLFDRALQGKFQPGSTFKVMTGAAAIDTGTETPDSEFYCPGYLNIGNYTIHEMQGEVHGHVNLGQALAQSCNITFAQVGLALGAERFKEYADRFWVDKRLDFVLPTATGQVVNRPAAPSAGANTRKAPPNPLGGLRQKGILAQSAFGQGEVAITPLEDCMISAAVANGGVLMQPYLVDRVVDPAGKTVLRTQPKVLSQPVTSETASKMTQMMELTFTEGTARHLQVPGLLMAGKTGTAQNPHGRTHAWFVGFAPADHPRVVAACIVENGGVGGIEAGPVVRAAILAALKQPDPGAR